MRPKPGGALGSHFSRRPGAAARHGPLFRVARPQDAVTDDLHPTRATRRGSAPVDLPLRRQRRSSCAEQFVPARVVREAQGPGRIPVRLLHAGKHVWVTEGQARSYTHFIRLFFPFLSFLLLLICFSCKEALLFGKGPQWSLLVVIHLKWPRGRRSQTYGTERRCGE